MVFVQPKPVLWSTKTCALVNEKQAMINNKKDFG